jgi:hypothetical protein
MEDAETDRPPDERFSKKYRWVLLVFPERGDILHNGGDELSAMDEEYLLDTMIAGAEEEGGKTVFFPSIPPAEDGGPASEEKLFAYLREIDR